MAVQVKSPEKIAASSSFTEGIAGLVAVVLAIIALAGLIPGIFMPVSTIALGVALIFEAGTIRARSSAISRERQEKELAAFSKWGGLSITFLAGVAGIVLGILALLSIAPMLLVPIAVIIFGAALVTDSGVRVRLSAIESERADWSDTDRTVAQETASATAGIQIFVGLAGIVLGVLALIGIVPIILSLVSLLTIGLAILVVGSVVGGRMIGTIRGSSY